MGALASRGWRFIAAVGLALVVAAVAPMACFFPSYTIEPAGIGGSGSTSTGPTMSGSSGSMGGGGMASTSGSGGGSPATSSASSSSASSSGSCPTMNCGDPSCTSYACVPAVPAGWTGFFELYDGPSVGAPNCGTEYPTQSFLGNAGLIPAAAMCSCGCSMPTGQTCTLTSAFTVTDAACGVTERCFAALPTDWTTPCVVSASSPSLAGGTNFCGPASNTCTSGSFAPCNVSASVGPTTVSGGSCTASAVTTTKPPPAWQSVGEACGGAAMTATGCTGGAVCLPKPEPGFGTSLCVMKAGNNTCSNPLFQHPHVFYTGVTDTRGCTACGCGAPSGSSCMATITAYASDTGCSGATVATITVDSNNGDCVALSGNPPVGARKVATMPPSGGSCTKTGGQPTGTEAEDATTAVTFCCQ